MRNDQIVKARRTLHRNPTPEDYGILLEKAVQQKEQKQTDLQGNGYFFKPGSGQDDPFGTGEGTDAEKVFHEVPGSDIQKQTQKIQDEGTGTRTTEASPRKASFATDQDSRQALWKKIAIAIAAAFIFVIILSGFTYPDAAVAVYRVLFLASAALAYVFAYRTRNSALAVIGGIAIGFFGTMLDLTFISVLVGENLLFSSDLLIGLWCIGIVAVSLFMGVKITMNTLYYTQINQKKQK